MKVISGPSPRSPWTPVQCNLLAAPKQRYCQTPCFLSSLNLIPLKNLIIATKMSNILFVAYYQVSRNLPDLLNFDEPVGLMWIIDGCFPLAWLSQTKTNTVEWDHQKFILSVGRQCLINSKVICARTPASLCTGWPWTQRWDDNI